MRVQSDKGSKSYSEAAVEFIEQIRQQSSLAAECLEQIRSEYGTRAAYLAAFALVFLKQQQKQRKYTPSSQDLHAFTYCEEMRDTAQAMQLYEEAAHHLLAESGGAGDQAKTVM